MNQRAAARLKRLFQKRVQLQMRVPTMARMRPYTTCRGPEQMLYARFPDGMAMPLQMAKPTMAPMLSSPADAISMEGMTAQTHACDFDHRVIFEGAVPGVIMQTSLYTVGQVRAASGSHLQHLKRLRYMI